MMPLLTDMWGSPSAPHTGGHELLPGITESYNAIYALLGARDIDDFVFTSSGAEAINQVILSAYFDVTIPTGKNHYVTSHIDEAPFLMAIGRLEQLGCVGKMVLPNKKGQVTAKAISEAISPRTALISISWANGLTGVINPIAEIAKLCEEREILLHLDATHLLGKLYAELPDIGAHFVSFNGEQLHAPKGTGGLFIKAGNRCSPFILGGIEQGGFRGGSYNLPGFAALGQAAKEAVDSRDLLCTEVARLRDKLEMAIVANYPEAIPFYCDQERLPHCTTIAFPGISNEAMLYMLNRKGVYANIGGGSFQQIALILTGAGIDEAIAHSAVNFSLSRETNEDEIDRAVAIIVECANHLKKNSVKLKG